MSCNCPTNFYKTPYNKNYQTLYCNQAQKADTALGDNVITSGWSYLKMNGGAGQASPLKPIFEPFCNCNSRLVNTPMVLKYKEDSRFC